MLLIEVEREHFQLLVSPDIGAVVPKYDHEYVMETLTEIAESMQREPIRLFKEISELSAGPLQTHRVGFADLHAEYLVDLCFRFENFKDIQSRLSSSKNAPSGDLG